MVSFHTAGDEHGSFFSSKLLKVLLLEVAYFVLSANGQQVGVSLRLRGATIPNGSFVDFDDIMYTAPRSHYPDLPSNNNTRDEALLCVTDLVDCCTAPHTVRGDWYFPDGSRVGFGGSHAAFQANRGPNEEINGQTFYGSVRLYRRYSGAPERGRFHCELPNAADPNVNQTLYAIIVNFGYNPTDYWTAHPVTISPSGSTTAGETDYSLTCSATLFDPIPLPDIVPSPTFEWFFGPNGNASLPSGVTPMATVLSSSNTTTSNTTTNTYSSTLQFSPLSQSHIGMYTCRLGAGRLVNSTEVTVNAPAISVQITTSKHPELGQNDYSLRCGVNGAENLNPSITYQWTKNNGTQTQIVGVNSNSLVFFRLRPSDAGLYSCNVTVLSAYVSSVVYASKTFEVTIINPTITVSVSSSVATPMVGSTYSLTCTVTGAERLTDAGAMVTYQWFKNDVMVSGQTMATLSFSPFTFSDAGSYTCEATVTSSLLSAPITTTSSNSLGVQLTLPRPTAIRVSTNQVNPLMVRPVGSTVTLTCMADLDPAIDVPVTVNIQLSDPAGRTLTTTTPSVSGSTYTSSATTSSFGRSESGIYTCSATVNPSPSNSFLSNSSSQYATLRVTTGVYLSLKGTVYANNSLIPINEIGETNPDTDLNDGLQCITDRIPCCRFALRAGEWYMYIPERIMVPGPLTVVRFYRNRGRDDGTVNLNRPSNVTSPTGLFCCEVPDATDVMQKLCADITASIRIIHSPTLGQSYALTCELISLSTGASDPITPSAYLWRKEGTMLSETGPTLSFLSLSLSDAGQYTCQVAMNGVMFSGPTQHIKLTIPPTASVFTTSGGQKLSTVLSTCSSEVGTAVGTLLLVEGIIAIVTAVIVVSCWLIIRKRKSGKRDFAVSANMAYHGQVNPHYLGDASGASGESGEYEDPDRTIRSGCVLHYDEVYEPIEIPAAQEHTSMQRTR